jgi:2,3-bisphosphoglycerate-dependent phosphoglycerate mutase
MAKLILMRHGQSVWNQKNLFTGWVDVPLTEKGIEEALEGGKKIRDIPIDIVYVSSLIRAQMTAFLAMLHHSSKKVCVLQHADNSKLQQWAKIHDKQVNKEVIPVYQAWELNERMYGDLQGLNKEAVKKKFGEEQFIQWRRSYAIAPPNGESLKMTAERTLPFFKSMIVPFLEKGKNVFVSAHGNSLRAILMDLDKLSEEAVVKLEIATGDPILYSFEQGKWHRI